MDAKFKIGGVEATDLLIVLILAAVLNLLFGRLSFGPILIFGIPLALFIALYYGKRGKPDRYLLHALRYFISTGELRAGEKEERYY